MAEPNEDQEPNEDPADEDSGLFGAITSAIGSSFSYVASSVNRCTSEHEMAPHAV